MKNQTILATFLAILLSVVGCGKNEAPVKVGPFDVNSSTRVATGQAFGVDFKVGGASGAEVKSHISGSPQSPSQADITLADDVKIKLQTLAGSDAVTLELNGKTFGKLQKGDKVLIDQSRDLLVNGEKRTAEDSPAK